MGGNCVIEKITSPEKGNITIFGKPYKFGEDWKLGERFTKCRNEVGDKWSKFIDN